MNGVTHDEKSEKATSISGVSVHAANTLEHGEYPAVHLLTEQENRRIRWKIDLVVLPCIVISMTLAFLDKNALSYAAVWGIRADTHLVGQEYSWVASVFYFGYLAMEFPTLYILRKVPIGKYIGCLVAVWGAVILCMAATKNYAGLVAVRVVMGILEAGLLPAFMILNSMWWRKEEQPLRTALWFNTFAGVFGGILSYAIGTTVHGSLAIWKYIFLIYGAITIFVGIVIFFVLPDTPSQAWFLSPHERNIVHLRTVENQTGADTKSKDIDWYQILEAVKSPMYWTLMVLAIAQPITNAGVSNFNPLILSQFGYSTAKTTLMATPQAAVAMGGQLSLTFLALKIKNIRSILWVFSTLPALIGAILLHVLDPVTQRSGCLAGIYLMGFYNCGWVFAVSLATSNTAGTSKKAFVTISFGIAYAVGNLVGPQFFLNSQSPVYETGILAMLICFAIMGGSGIVYGSLCVAENRRRDRKGTATVERVLATGEKIDNNSADLTDGQNELFRYSY